MSRNAKRRNLAISLAIIVAAFVAAGAMVQAFREPPPERETPQIDALVDVIELESMTANFTVRSQGTVRPRTETILSAEVSGTITEISPKFIAGGVFASNEVLMRIDPTNYTVAVDQAEALVKQRQIEFDGAEKLRQSGYRAEAELASAAAALATARADLVRARRDLERTYIRLPYEGMVRAKEVDLGRFVNPGTRLGVVFATNYAEVRLPLTDGDLAVVDLPNPSEITETGGAPGPAVTLSAVQRGKRAEWQAQIVRGEGVVDESSRVTYAVARVHDPYRLHDGGTPLPMGTFVAAEIAGTGLDGIVRVPRTALRGSDQLIFVDDESRIRIRSVEIARADAAFIYVSTGAAPGDRIVTTALETPVNGMRVRTGEDVPDSGETARSRVGNCRRGRLSVQVPGITGEKGIIAWFASNHVAANLLMLFIIVAGLLSVLSITKETQPEFQLNWVQVRVSYLGAAPEEVEEGVVIKVEEAIQDVKGIKRIRSTAREGVGVITAEIDLDHDVDVALNEIKVQVDAIQTFPGLTEKPTISKIDASNPVALIAIHGDIDAFMRKAIAQEVRDELMQLPEVNEAVFLR